VTDTDKLPGLGDDAQPPTDEPQESVPAEFQALVGVIERLESFDSGVTLEWLDGFLTALAAMPQIPPHEAWLGWAFGDSFDRAFADPQAQAEALLPLSARVQALREALNIEALVDDDEALRLEPLMQLWSDADRAELVAQGVPPEDAAQMQTGGDWSSGFLSLIGHGADVLPQLRAGSEADQYQQHLLRTVESLQWDPSQPEFQAFAAEGWKNADPTRDELVTEACFAVQELRVFWYEESLRPAPRQAQAVPGRNEPCFCGSGKKFKKCHGA
jgi:uncharacterized protein